MNARILFSYSLLASDLCIRAHSSLPSISVCNFVVTNCGSVYNSNVGHALWEGLNGEMATCRNHRFRNHQPKAGYTYLWYIHIANIRHVVATRRNGVMPCRRLICIISKFVSRTQWSKKKNAVHFGKLRHSNLQRCYFTLIYLSYLGYNDYF